MLRPTGRLTFTPLKRLATKAPKFPEGIPADDAVPLLSLLTFNSRFAPAVHAAFGKVMVCRNIDVAERLADAHKLTCVTQDGAKAKGRGEFSGGFYEPGKGIFGLRDGLKAARDAVGSLEARFAELNKVRNGKGLSQCDYRLCVLNFTRWYNDGAAC